VNERWVCKRCFADNEESSAACHRCGLTRGAEASQADQQGWAGQAGGTGGAPVAQQQQGGGWTRWIRFWWIPAVVVVLAVGYFTQARRGDTGEINSGGTVDVTELQVGDCFDSPTDEDLISDVTGVPCDEAHAYEVYAVAEREAASYPTDDEFDTIFGELCVPAFESYVGASYEDSDIWASFITPSEDSWSDGDREYVCYLYEPVDPDDPAGATVELTSSLEGAGR
jgi:putative regulator of septum formation